MRIVHHNSDIYAQYYLSQINKNNKAGTLYLILNLQENILESWLSKEMLTKITN